MATLHGSRARAPDDSVTQPRRSQLYYCELSEIEIAIEIEVPNLFDFDCDFDYDKTIYM
jgi:hypothetical protein